MISLSRRHLARYGAAQLIAGQPVVIVARELASVLLESKRAKEADMLVADIAWELESRGKVANVKVTSAFPLSPLLKSDIEKFIKDAAKVDDVILDELTDKKVLGGVRIETAARAWDKTVARALSDIREEF
jgi:F0F1-type ATP synthase delta subunit